MQDAEKLFNQLIQLLTFEHAQIDYSQDDDSTQIIIQLPQEESGILIGYRGEKIDALQLITSLMINQDNITYKPVQIDINGYRENRQKSLQEIADKAMGKAIESGREILLPPMPANERRIIHMYLNQKDEVSTYSEGEGSSRRIVVRPSD